jgi:glycosyltransferase involved in cell wall biosynthesis
MAPAPGTSERPVVCHLIETLLHGGAEAAVHGLALGSRAAGYEVVVCCFVPGPVVEQLERDGIRVEALNLRRPSVLSVVPFVRYVWRSFAGLQRVLTTRRVTLIHAHLPDSIMWAVILGALRGIPVVATYHGPQVMPMGRGRLDPRNALRRAAYRLAHRACARTIAVSEAIRDLLSHDYGFARERTVLIPNPVNTARFASQPPDASLRRTLGLDGCRVLTCVGRLVPGKGQRYLVEAFASLRDKYRDVQLVLVGDGPERAALERQVQEHGLADRVLLLGGRNDVPALLALSTIFVLPTFTEGLPIAVVEAMAAAAPVVVTAIPGNIEVVGDERHGKLVPPGDAAALATAIASLLDDPAGAREMGRRGQAWVRARFDLPEVVSRTAAVYTEVLGGEPHVHSPAA